MSKKPARFMELEGLRGLAAVSVALYHFIVLFYPAMRKGDMSLANSRFEEYIYGTPLTILFAGTLAVAIFFVMSGFVLSIAFFKTGDDNIVKKLAASRYLRLMLPALASVLVAWSLIQVGSHHLTSQAGEIAGSSYLAGKWRNDPGLFGAVTAGAVDIFVEFKGDSRAINHVLWTMNVEFIGSFLVFGFLLLFAKSKYRWIAYTVLAIGTFGTWYLGFIIGMMLADAYTLGWLEKLKRTRVVVPMLILAVFLGIFPKRVRGTVYEFLDLSALDVSNRIFYLTISATLIILAILLSKHLTRWLQKPILSSLGRYTFSLYLTHLFVIYTVSTSIVIALHDVIGYNESVVVAFLASLPAFWAVSYIFERYIDVPSIKFAKWAGSIYRGETKIKWHPTLEPLAKKFRLTKGTVYPRELDEAVD